MVCNFFRTLSSFFFYSLVYVFCCLYRQKERRRKRNWVYRKHFFAFVSFCSALLCLLFVLLLILVPTQFWCPEMAAVICPLERLLRSFFPLYLKQWFFFSHFCRPLLMRWLWAEKFQQFYRLFYVYLLIFINCCYNCWACTGKIMDG